MPFCVTFLDNCIENAMPSLHVQLACVIEPGAVVLRKLTQQWHSCFKKNVTQNAEKVQKNPFPISIGRFKLFKNKVKVLLYGNNYLHVASLMIGCMHRIHALKRGSRCLI